jgi:hypothetical protein
LTVYADDAPRRRSARAISRVLPADRATRGLSLAVLINTSGNGLYITAAALFYTRGIGLSISKVGVGLTVAGVIGWSGAIVGGRLADRYGCREVCILLLLAETVSFASLDLVHSVGELIVVAAIATASIQAYAAAQGALIGRVGGRDVVVLRAYQHSVNNLGVALGTGAAGIVIAINTAAAYKVMMLANAASFLGAALMLAIFVPTQSVIPRPSGNSTRAPLRDIGYLSVTAINSVLCLQFLVFTFPLPLWVATHTSAPTWIVSPLLLINTGLIIVLQVRFAKGTQHTDAAARAVRRAGIVLALAMAAYALAAGVSLWLAILVLLAAAILHTIGELWQQSGAFNLSYGLAQEHAIGEYQGIFALGVGVSRVLGPATLIALCLNLGVTGWLALGCLFGLTGLVAPGVIRWADRRRFQLAEAPS